MGIRELPPCTLCNQPIVANGAHTWAHHMRCIHCHMACHLKCLRAKEEADMRQIAASLGVDSRMHDYTRVRLRAMTEWSCPVCLVNHALVSPSMPGGSVPWS